MSDSFIVNPECRRPAPPIRRSVLVTGAGGTIGQYFAEHAHHKHDLILLVHSESNVSKVSSYGRVEVGGLEDLERLKRLFDGVDTVVHLAARASPSETWEPLLQSNIVGTYNVFVAAHAAGCRRVVFASSIHAVSGYSPDRQVQPDDPVSPGDLYGVTKCFGEAMGRFMATQHGLSVLCLRIGAFQPRDVARQEDSVALMDAFVSPRDLHQLIDHCIDDDSLQFGLLHGLSDNRFNRLNIAEARELVGYAPQDDFTQENPELAPVDLRGRVRPHSEQKPRPSGIRDDVDPRACDRAAGPDGDAT